MLCFCENKERGMGLGMTGRSRPSAAEGKATASPRDKIQVRFWASRAMRAAAVHGAWVRCWAGGAGPPLLPLLGPVTAGARAQVRGRLAGPARLLGCFGFSSSLPLFYFFF